MFCMFLHTINFNHDISQWDLTNLSYRYGFNHCQNFNDLIVGKYK